MARKTEREQFMKSITVQPEDCEDFVLIPAAFLRSLREEIDDLRAKLGLSQRAWESPRTADAVATSPQGSEG